MDPLTTPALRPLDFQPVTYQNEQMWLLRDPLRLTEFQIIVPAPLAQMLPFIDGTRTPDQICHDFSRYVGTAVDPNIITHTLAKLDEACLLENDRAAAARQQQLAAYRAQPVRPPALADLSYPADPDSLTAQFAAYGRGDDRSAWPAWHGRGIIAPHIDYQRGGPVYAKTWQRAAGALQEADLVLIFGTDHNGGPGSVTLTRLPFATPYGTLPTDTALIDQLAEAIGPDAAFAEELHHRDEHSIELSAVWLHHLTHTAGLPPKPMLPILIGSFMHFVQDGTHPADDARITAVVDTLKQLTAGKNVVAVASVDLAHVGPQFGDSHRMDARRRALLRESDAALMATAVGGDADEWYRQIAAVGDRNRICGFSPVYYLLRFLGPTTGHQIAYAQCPADAEDESLVSICGLLLD